MNVLADTPSVFCTIKTIMRDKIMYDLSLCTNLRGISRVDNVVLFYSYHWLFSSKITPSAVTRRNCQLFIYCRINGTAKYMIVTSVGFENNVIHKPAITNYFLKCLLERYWFQIMTNSLFSIRYRMSERIRNRHN